MSAPKRSEITSWIAEAWAELTAETIVTKRAWTRSSVGKSTAIYADGRGFPKEEESSFHRGYTYYGQVKRVAVDDMTSEVYPVVAMIMGTRRWSNTAWPITRNEVKLWSIPSVTNQSRLSEMAAKVHHGLISLTPTWISTSAEAQKRLRETTDAAVGALTTSKRSRIAFSPSPEQERVHLALAAPIHKVSISTFPCLPLPLQRLSRGVDSVLPPAALQPTLKLPVTASKNRSVSTFRDRLHFWPSEIPSKVRVYIEEKLGGLRVKGSRA
eukprot:jgi/Phyca11/13402/fgenesh1_pg.PHYCAscaffold_3_\